MSQFPRASFQDEALRMRRVRESLRQSSPNLSAQQRIQANLRDRPTLNNVIVDPLDRRTIAGAVESQGRTGLDRLSDDQLSLVATPGRLRNPEQGLSEFDRNLANERLVRLRQNSLSPEQVQDSRLRQRVIQSERASAPEVQAEQSQRNFALRERQIRTIAQQQNVPEAQVRAVFLNREQIAREAQQQQVDQALSVFDAQTRRVEANSPVNVAAVEGTFGLRERIVQTGGEVEEARIGAEADIFGSAADERARLAEVEGGVQEAAIGAGAEVAAARADANARRDAARFGADATVRSAEAGAAADVQSARERRLGVERQAQADEFAAGKRAAADIIVAETNNEGKFERLTAQGIIDMNLASQDDAAKMDRLLAEGGINQAIAQINGTTARTVARLNADAKRFVALSEGALQNQIAQLRESGMNSRQEAQLGMALKTTQLELAGELQQLEREIGNNLGVAEIRAKSQQKVAEIQLDMARVRAEAATSTDPEEKKRLEAQAELLRKQAEFVAASTNQLTGESTGEGPGGGELPDVFFEAQEERGFLANTFPFLFGR